MLWKFILLIICLFCIFSNMVFATYRIDAIEYPKEILIERGWTKYFNVIVKNTGDTGIKNVMISFDGEFPKWFEIQTNKIDVLQANNNVSFFIRLNVPANAESGTYSFILYAKSNEVINNEEFTVRVFKSKSDSTLYQIQELETEIEDIKRNATRAEVFGKNVTSIIQQLNEAGGYLDISRDYVAKENYEKATELMINVENLIKKAEYDLSIAPKKTTTEIQNSGFPAELIVLMPSPVVAIVAVLFYNKKIKKKEVTLKPMVKIKEIVLEGRDMRNLEDELKKIQNSRNLLEEEYRENLISSESYEEIKSKYERRITELNAEIERNRKIV